jgi:cytidylate kinase
MYIRNEKINRLMTGILKGTHFVMAGSMDSFNALFVPIFDLAIHITASIDTRIARIHKREYEVYGGRIMEGGDMYEGQSQKELKGYSQRIKCSANMTLPLTTPC